MLDKIEKAGWARQARRLSDTILGGSELQQILMPTEQPRGCLVKNLDGMFQEPPCLLL
jgi:hypothetical protein